jgi:hypothetical protein
VAVIQYINLDEDVADFKSNPERMIKADCAWRDLKRALCSQFSKECCTTPAMLTQCGQVP